MEKLILKKIKLVFSIICIFIFMLFSILIFYTKSNSIIGDLDELISQIELLYNKSKIDNEKTMQLFEEDYLNRAYAIEFIVSNTENESFNNELLQKMKSLMEVNAIHIIDFNGEIVLSGDLESVGVNILDSNQSSKFWDLVKTNNENQNVIEINGKSILDNEDKIYIGVKVSSDKYSVVQIELDKKVLEDYLYNNYITTIVKNIPTVDENTIFIVDKNNSDIEAITQNNDEDIILDNVNSKNEFLEKLYEYNNGNLIKINGKLRYLKTKVIDNYIIGTYINADVVYSSLIEDMFYLIICIVLILLFIILILKYSIKKYILKDIFNIQHNVKALMDGNYDVEFESEYNTELRNVSNILNQWKEGYTDKSERMTRMMASINSHVAIFECLYIMNRNFFSDNMKDLLGLDDNTWFKISRTPKSFEMYIHSLLQNGKNSKGLILCNNRFIHIEFFKEKNQFYGMIIDKTEDENIRIKMEREIIDKKLEAQTDPLTKLLNRAGLENSIKNSIKNTQGKAVMLMLDLDNFKVINDKLGHPVGDEVLKEFTECLKSFFCEKSLVSRIAGDEFIVFIDYYIDKNRLEDILKNLIEKIHRDLNEYRIKYKLSASIGVIYVNKQIDTYEELYKKADIALYKAKDKGKDTFYIM